MSIPDFATHYHPAARAPFLNLSDLDEAARTEVLAALAAEAAGGTSQRRFGPHYMALRLATESRLRQKFLERGGRPERSHPHYFVLGESAWFRGLYATAGEVRVALADLPERATSVTLPDSMTSMGLGARFGVPSNPQPYHDRVFLLAELPDVVEQYGLLSASEPRDYAGHQFAAFEHYIEIQVWADCDGS